MVFKRTQIQFPDSDVTRPKFTTVINACIITVQYNNKTKRLEISQGVDLVRGEMGVACRKWEEGREQKL